ncbi:coiled-coil domain-containing protein 1-like [Ylistrum balloti]|uniref:coiled-coil domain-containing protein 1-like n=1 Tax=Ylistrum balloti TaxID=509963 RepID=UPI002905F4C8|nr:coiled-coil domain-containing protein 1-like [Ylistrum balloti]
MTQQEDILEEVRSFYEKLYDDSSEIEDIDFTEFLDVFDVPKLDNDEAKNLEGLITVEEAAKTLKNMKNNKSPEYDDVVNDDAIDNDDDDNVDNDDDGMMDDYDVGVDDDDDVDDDC